MDDILLIGKDFEMLSKVKIQLVTQFQMKDFGEAQYVLGIKIIRDRKNKIIALSQENYIDSDRTRPGYPTRIPFQGSPGGPA